MAHEQTKPTMFHWQTDEPVTNPSSLNYHCISKCDGCGETKHGMMFHTAGATGRVCPVLFLCSNCDNGL